MAVCGARTAAGECKMPHSRYAGFYTVTVSWPAKSGVDKGDVDEVIGKRAQRYGDQYGPRVCEYDFKSDTEAQQAWFRVQGEITRADRRSPWAKVKAIVKPPVENDANWPLDHLDELSGGKPQTQQLEHVCPNCDQWQSASSLGYYDCCNGCAFRGLVPKIRCD